MIGASPSGKASGFGSDIRRFESYRPSYLEMVHKAHSLRMGFVSSLFLCLRYSIYVPL